VFLKTVRFIFVKHNPISYKCDYMFQSKETIARPKLRKPFKSSCDIKQLCSLYVIPYDLHGLLQCKIYKIYRFYIKLYKIVELMASWPEVVSILYINNIEMTNVNTRDLLSYIKFIESQVLTTQCKTRWNLLICQAELVDRY